jgi:carbon-monoxide dehydrogenase small subunit
MKIEFTLNKQKYAMDVDPRKSLLELVREIGLTGAKLGCGVGECGACTMVVDGEIINACIYLAVRADGKEITTIEGVGGRDSLTEVQQSFVDSGAVQCGFCTPGMVLAATNLLEHNPNPTREQVRREMSGNLCRCTGYKKIVDAVMAVGGR